MGLFERFVDPPKQYTLIPFWFLNDALDETELRRQIDAFAEHGVYGFIPHARMGLPEDIPFMSDRWLHFVKVAVDYAAEKGLFVILYDEGMYPSGSCAGQVVAANPRHATRCLERRPVAHIDLGPDEELVAKDEQWAYVHSRSMGTIRGAHYGPGGEGEFTPPSGDILNPEAVASFLHLTHDRHFEALGPHFGKTVLAIFTDEPSMLGRGGKKEVQPWTWGLETFLEASLGYDFRPHLSCLWEKKGVEAERRKADFARALNARLEQTFYKPYSEWCTQHGVALTGHPAGPMDIGTLKYFQIPGQDVVWRYLEPFQDKSLEGDQSTMGKSSSSAQANYGRARNLNECFGAYGWNLTYEEMRWVTNWLLVRGVNLLSPHAFYYSVRGKRREERPPDVGPNNTWWDRYKVYADYCRRVCWLLAEGKQVCRVAILGTPIFLPWNAARVLFEHQIDFNYLDTDTLALHASVDKDAITVGEMRYEALVIDGAETAPPEALAKLKPFLDAGRVLAYAEPVGGVPHLAANAAELVESLAAWTPPEVKISPAHRDLRYYHVRHPGADLYFFTNEGREGIDVELNVAAAGRREWWDPETAQVLSDADGRRVQLAPYTGRVLCVWR